MLLCIITDRQNVKTNAAFLMDIQSVFLEDLPLAVLRDIWYQQDGAPSHRASVAQE